MERYLAGKKCLVMSRDEVRAFDGWAINEIGVPGVVLMENAGRSCAELIKEKLSAIDEPKICIFCGRGNNGGDGYVVARHLLNSGFRVTVVLCGERSKVKGDAKINLEILERLRQRIEQLDISANDIAEKVGRFAADSDMIADALFGTGLRGHLDERYIALIEAINAQGCPVTAIDIPSGLDCDTGQVLGAGIKASYTVTFAAVKRGFVVPGAERYTGEVYVAGIGAEPSAR